MLRKTMILLLCLCACGCQQGSSSIQQTEDSAPAAIADSTVTLIVHGMSCPLCATNVDKQLLKIKGVSSVHADLGNGRVTVGLLGSRRPTAAQFEEAVKNSGFTLVRIDDHMENDEHD